MVFVCVVYCVSLCLCVCLFLFVFVCVFVCLFCLFVCLFVCACADIDECGLDAAICDEQNVNASCINTQGNYDCVCGAGYTGNLTLCLGIVLIQFLRKNC